MPDNIIRQAVHAVARSSRHLGEAFCFRLVFEGVAGEVDTCESVHVSNDSSRRDGGLERTSSMNIRLDQNINSKPSPCIPANSPSHEIKDKGGESQPIGVTDILWMNL